jgi:hypothetical protein
VRKLKTLNLVESSLDHDNEIDYGKYGFEVLEVKRGQAETDFKAIFNKKTDKIVAFTRKSYKLLPNEVVLDAADDMAECLHLERFKVLADATESWNTYGASPSKYYRSKKEGRTVVQTIVGSEHAILDASATRIFAFYKLPKLEIMDSKDEMNFGILVRNSVDGSSGLNIDGFSFRHICSNISIMGLMHISALGRKTGIRRRHTKNLDITLGNLKNMMGSVSKQMYRVRETYAGWMVEEVNKETIKKIGTSIPVKYLPDYLDVSENKPTITLPTMPTKWKMYNDLTQKIWHEPVAMQTKMALFEKLHAGFVG